MASNLTRTDSVDSGDLFVLYKTSAGDYRGIPNSDVLTWIQDGLTFPSAGIGEFVTQYAVPSSAGFNVTLTALPDGAQNTHLILTPTTGLASGTITLPAVANVVDKQEVLVNCTQQVTALTVDGNGATAVTGELSSLAADDFFRLKYDAVSSTWYRVG